MKLKTNLNGYHFVQLSKKGQHTCKLVHRLVCACFKRNKKSPKHEINHKDGIKTNNCVSNLEWVTHTENVQHAIRTGLHKRLLIYTANPVIDIRTKEVF